MTRTNTRWAARKLRTLSLLCVLCLAGIGTVGAQSAHAGHSSCLMTVYTPWKGTYTGSTTKFIKFEADVNCADNTNGTFVHEAQRDRWWGWENLYDQSGSLGDHGNRRLAVPLDCAGPSISAGTWTFRSLATVSVSHITGFAGFTGVGNTYRTTCS